MRSFFFSIVALSRDGGKKHPGKPRPERIRSDQEIRHRLGRVSRNGELAHLLPSFLLFHLEHVEEQIEHLLSHDQQVKGLQEVPEFGSKTVAVLWAELGEVVRFQRLDQVVAYAGMDIEIKQSGKWQGQAKLSKRGSGLVRRMLSVAAMRCIWLPGSAFGIDYHRLLARGVGKMTALMAVMRKMLVVAASLLRTGEDYDPTRVAVGPAG